MLIYAAFATAFSLLGLSVWLDRHAKRAAIFTFIAGAALSGVCMFTVLPA
jgi:hypothetical protein